MSDEINLSRDELSERIDGLHEAEHNGQLVTAVILILRQMDARAERSVRRLAVIVAIGLAVTVASGVLALITIYRTGDLSRETRIRSLATQNSDRIVTKALCTYRDELQARINASQKSLTDYPHGKAGYITEGALKINLVNQKNARKSLNILICP